MQTGAGIFALYSFASMLSILLLGVLLGYIARKDEVNRGQSFLANYLYHMLPYQLNSCGM